VGAIGSLGQVEEDGFRVASSSGSKLSAERPISPFRFAQIEVIMKLDIDGL
jgi:hypothetical protein